MSLALFAALALTSAPAFAVDGPQTLFDVQARVRELPAAAAAKPRLAALACRAFPRALDCAVDGERAHRKFRVSGDSSRQHFRMIETKVDGKPVVDLLDPLITHDYDVYYEFDQAAYAAFVKGQAPSVKGAYVEKVERTEPRSTPAVCSLGEYNNVVYFSLTGELDLDSLKLKTSRGGDSPLIATANFGGAVDGRCGELSAPMADNYNFYVTPRHYWGEDILQLPKNAPLTGASFRAGLHACQYDGEWHDSDNVALQCSLSPR